MSRKPKHKPILISTSALVGAVVVLAALGMVLQVRTDLMTRTGVHARMPAVTLAAPDSPGGASLPKAATPAPKSSPIPSHSPAPVPVRVAKKSVPVVKPAPHSSVSNLAPVTQPPASGPAPAPTPGSSPSASPTPPVYAYTSSNWSGYLASDGTFTSISGSWVVPNATGNGHSISADATWIGIGGVTSSDLIQVGTSDTVTRSGAVSSEAFYEMLPAASTAVPGMTVTPGDAMSADLAETSPGQWQISITDTTRSETFSTSAAYTSSHSTAEWIEEDPSFSAGHQIPFDDFGAVSFNGAGLVENGGRLNLLTAGAQAIIMQTGGRIVATPSGIGADGASFSVTGGD